MLSSLNGMYRVFRLVPQQLVCYLGPVFYGGKLPQVTADVLVILLVAWCIGIPYELVTETGVQIYY
jgi:hypothetical protein